LSHRTAVKRTVISLALSASWPTWSWAQPAPPLDKPPIVYRRDSPGRACTLAGPDYHAGAVTFSPDGSRLFVGYDDGSIRQHDAKSGRQLGPTVENGSTSIQALAISPDGQGLAVAALPPGDALGRGPGPAGDVITIRRPVGTEIGKLSQMPGHVIALAYAADGKTIGAIDQFYDVRVWRVEDRGEVLNSEVHQAGNRGPEGATTRASFSADLKRAVIVNDTDSVTFKDAPWNHLVRLWEAGSKEPRFSGVRSGLGICCALVSPDGSQFVVAQELHNVYHNDFASGRCLSWQYPASARRGDELAFLMLSPDNRRRVSATKRYVVVDKLDDKLNGRHGFAGPHGYVRAAAFVPKGVRFATGGWDPLGNQKIAGTDLPKYEPVLLWEVEVEGM